MKVFISHQKNDSTIAQAIGSRLWVYHDIDYYLDVIDPHLGKAGDDLAKHLQIEIGKCTHLIAVTSAATRTSMWVPWEIGIATEKHFPLATFADYVQAVPEFLEAWPYLRTMQDVDLYAKAAKYANPLSKSVLTEEARVRTSDSFFIKLRQELNQPITRARY